MNIPDTLCQQLVSAVQAAEAAASGSATIGPAMVTIVPGSPFLGADWNITFTPLDGSPAKTLHVLAIPRSLGTYDKPVDYPVSASFTLSVTPDGYDKIVNVTMEAEPISNARILAITPSADKKVTKIDLYLGAGVLGVSLHVTSVPAGWAAFDGKNYGFYYTPGTNGGLDTIIISTITVS
jgi:hypothetical protein